MTVATQPSPSPPDIMISQDEKHLRTENSNGQSQDENLMPLCQIATPVGMLGYGFDDKEFDAALQNLTSCDVPTAIILDSGSTDSGPSKLASGISTCPRSAYKKDLTKLLKAHLKYNIPLLISSAGGDGSDAHVDEFVDIISEIMADLDKKLKVLAVYGQVSKSFVLDRFHRGEITGCGPVVPPLTVENIETSPTIVAQMGPEPLLQAMTSTPDFDILIAGRAYDPAPFIAYCAFQAIKRCGGTFESLGTNILGGFTHMGKIMECGGSCATPKGRGAISTMYTDGTFDIKPTDPKAKCTILSVAAHTLYEKTRPDILHGPGGWLDLTATKYQQLVDDVSVRVRGATFTFTTDTGSPYTVKIEGARHIGFRTLFLGHFKDPILIGQLKDFLNTGREHVTAQNPPSAGAWKIDFHLTGLEEQDDSPRFIAKKVFIVGEILAETQELANEVAHSARIYCAHGPYPNQKGTSGNFAMGIGGQLDIPLGECAEFTIYHLVNLKPGECTAREVIPEGDMGQSSGTPLFSWKKIFVNRSLEEVKEQTSGHVKRPFQLQKAKLKEMTDERLSISSSPRVLRDIAKVIRSKNAGPFELTFDIMFESTDVYQAVKESGMLCPETIANIYKIGSTDDILWCGFFDQALAFKVTLPRTRNGAVICSGGYMEDDVHGSQQYIPLMELALSDDLVLKLETLLRDRMLLLDLA